MFTKAIPSLQLTNLSVNCSLVAFVTIYAGDTYTEEGEENITPSYNDGGSNADRLRSSSTRGKRPTSLNSATAKLTQKRSARHVSTSKEDSSTPAPRKKRARSGVKPKRKAKYKSKFLSSKDVGILPQKYKKEPYIEILDQVLSHIKSEGDAGLSSIVRCSTDLTVLKSNEILNVLLKLEKITRKKGRTVNFIHLTVFACCWCCVL